MSKGRGIPLRLNEKLCSSPSIRTGSTFSSATARMAAPTASSGSGGLTVTQIHGGMKIGDRDTPGSRIYAEREFRESAQVLVATEAAGEGINLQFCSQMINYDIPWNPVRLEQRVGVSTATARSTTVSFLISSPIIPAKVACYRNSWSACVRSATSSGPIRSSTWSARFSRQPPGEALPDLYARRTNEHAITDRIVREIDPTRFREITQSALEGLAKKQLNLSAIIGKSVEAKEGRLVPEAIKDFFVVAAPETGIYPQEVGKDSNIYRVGKIPRTLIQRGNALEHRFGKLGREYGASFRQGILKKDPTLEWVTPGHPLFETVRDAAIDRVHDDLKHGAIFYDIQRKAPSVLDVFAASVKDGRGRTLHRRLFVVETDAMSLMTLRQPTVFHDINPAPKDAQPVRPEILPQPDRVRVKQYLFQEALSPWLAGQAGQRSYRN